MKYPGWERVKKVYSVWTILYLSLFILMILFGIKIPSIILIITILFSLKTILFDYKIMKVKRKRVYWLEHGPFLIEVVILGLLAYRISSLQGYINLPTILIAIVGFFLDFIKDLKEEPKAYDR